MVYGGHDDDDDGNDVWLHDKWTVPSGALCVVAGVLKIVDTEEDGNADDDVEHDNDVDNDDDTDDGVEDQPNTSHHVTRRGQGVLKPGRHLRYLQEM